MSDNTKRDSETRRRGQLAQRAAHYVTELSAQSPIVSTSHHELRRMYDDFGQEDADAAVEREFERIHEIGIGAAARAVETIDADELEEHAAKLRQTDNTSRKVDE
jgi:hypothetical protein